MAYRLRVYAPTRGVEEVEARASGGGVLQYGPPEGTSTPCIDQDELTVGVTISATLAPGYAVDQWVVNIDGDVSYKTTTSCKISYSGTMSNVQVRLEVVEEAPQATYSATLRFSANGGTGAPGSITETGDGEYVDITIPRDEPTRTGYFFEGWADDDAATKAQYHPGRTYSWYATEAGYTHRLYAVWTKEQTGSVRLGPYFELYTPYIWTSSGWQRATAHIWDNGWKRGS